MTARSKKRLLHLLSGCTVGGCEQHVLSLLSRLDRDRYEPWLAYFEAAPDQAEPMAPAFRAVGVRTVDLGARRRTDPRALVRLGHLLRRVRFDLIHAHSWRTELGAVLWGRVFSRVPVVLRTVHNTDEFYVRPGYASLARASANRLDRIVVISDAVGRYLREAGVPAEKLVRIYYGLDVRGWGSSTENSCSPSAIPHPQTSIAVVARLAPQKGHTILLDALPRVLASVPDVSVRIVGHEELSTVAELRAYAAARGVAEHVEFDGFRGDVPELLREIDLFVLPSLWEGFGLVLLEAMAAGRPIVASAVGPIPEVVLDGETGLLVPPGDPGALAEAIVRVLSDRALAERLGRAGRARVERAFGLDRMVEQTDALYRELLGRTMDNGQGIALVRRPSSVVRGSRSRGK
jgi:glycosyltransferase involved in cell wall biosynthesis